MTLDQCMNCTRYEPILGQVYAILDENATNLSQVLDDIQMSYMTMEEYAQFTRIEEMINEKEFANIKNDGEIPKTFYETYPEETKEGYQMDWTSTQLENQRPDIAEYNAEGIEPKKPVIEDDNQGTVEEEFKEVIEENEPAETIVYNSEDYNFNSFGAELSGLGSSGINGTFGMGSSAIRNKIVEYAKDAVTLCGEGKAGYSQDKRYSHLEQAVNGISYWDCSSLVEGAYKAASITSVAGTTYTEFPVCLPTAGGILLHVSQMNEAKPGDIVFVTEQSPAPTESNMTNATVSQIYHVGIYIGNGQYAHASSARPPLPEQIKISDVSSNPNIFAFGRPKELVEADEKAASLFGSGEGFLDYDSHGFSDEATELASKYAQSQGDLFIENMNKYGYKEYLVSACEGIGINPYIMAGMCANESTGDPTLRNSFGYTGLFQSLSARGTTNLDDIKHDIDDAFSIWKAKETAFKNMGFEPNLVMLIHAFNAGEGTVQKAMKTYGKYTINSTGGELGPPIANQAVAQWGKWKWQEVLPYVAKVILRANYLISKNALE